VNVWACHAASPLTPLQGERGTMRTSSAVMMIFLFIFDKNILVFLFGIEVISETEVDIVMAEVLP